MRLAVITGASSGLGQETARQLASSKRCDSLLLIARRSEKLKALAKELEEQGVLSIVLPLDLQADDASSKIKDQVVDLQKQGHQLTWLVLAAGFGKLGPLVKNKEEALNMLNLNCVALTAICADLLPLLHGYCLLFASVAAYVPQPNFAVYAASKAYVLSLAQALNCENENNIIAVCPNPVETEFFQDIGGNPAGIKKIGIEKASTVVRKAIRKVERGRFVSISSPLAKDIQLASKLLPHRFILRIEKLLGIY